MGIHTTEIRYDDLTGETSEDIKEFTFIVDGTKYTLDACPETRAAIRQSLMRFIEVASSEETNGSGDDPKIIRDWARQHGYSVSEKGRIPTAIVKAYHDAVK